MRYFLSKATLAATIAAATLFGFGTTPASADGYGGGHHGGGYGGGHHGGGYGGGYRGGYGCACGVRNCHHGYGYRPRPYGPVGYPRYGAGYRSYGPIVPPYRAPGYGFSLYIAPSPYGGYRPW